jgi:plasmid stabilization system protein ParE
MNYSLHPEAEEDLRDAAEFYRERAGNSLSQSLLAQFEQSVNVLLQHPGQAWVHCGAVVAGDVTS